MFNFKNNLTLFKERLRELREANVILWNKSVCPEKDQFIIDELQKLWEVVDDIQSDFENHKDNHAKKDYGY